MEIYKSDISKDTQVPRTGVSASSSAASFVSTEHEHLNKELLDIIDQALSTSSSPIFRESISLKDPYDTHVTYSMKVDAEAKVVKVVKSTINGDGTVTNEDLIIPIRVIKTGDSTASADTNVYSAKRADEEFLSKKHDDTVNGIITFAQGLDIIGKRLNDIIRQGDGYTPSNADLAVLSAARSFATFLRKDVPELLQYDLTHHAASVWEEAGRPYDGDILTGRGGKIDAAGNAGLESLTLRRFLEVPELRKNRVSIVSRYRFLCPQCTVESVSTSDRILKLKLEDGETNDIMIGGRMVGIWQNLDSNNTNATANSDDGKGNYTVKGFETVYVECTSLYAGIVDNSGNMTIGAQLAAEDYAQAKYMKYQLRSTTDSTWTRSSHPHPGMYLAEYSNRYALTEGNVAYGRGSSVIINTAPQYIRMYSGVVGWNFEWRNVVMGLGDNSNLRIFSDLNAKKFATQSFFINGDVYYGGKMLQYEGGEQSKSIVIERDPYNPATTIAQSYHEYSYNGDMWLFVGDTGRAGEVPSDNERWIKHSVHTNNPMQYLGHWTTSIASQVRENTIASMGKKKWLARRSTSQPPMGVYTDNAGNYYTQADGSYYLNGTENTFDWDVMAEDGVDGRDGKDGANGKDGKDGTSITITSTSVTYQISSSATTTPTGTWSGMVPATTDASPFLWSKTVVVYSDGTSTTAYSVSHRGKDGNDAPSITEITQLYCLSTSSASSPALNSYTAGAKLTTAQQKYLWTYVTYKFSNNTSKTMAPYVCAVYGDQGIQGATPKEVLWSERDQNGYFYAGDTEVNGAHPQHYLLIENATASVGYLVYRCTRTHAVNLDRLNSNGTLDVSNGYWTEVSSVNDMFVQHLIAKNIKMKFGSGYEQVIVDDNDNPQMVLSGKNTNADDVRFAAGINDVTDLSNSTTYITKGGHLKTVDADIEGKVTASEFHTPNNSLEIDQNGNATLNNVVVNSYRTLFKKLTDSDAIHNGNDPDVWMLNNDSQIDIDRWGARIQLPTDGRFIGRHVYILNGWFGPFTRIGFPYTEVFVAQNGIFYDQGFDANTNPEQVHWSQQFSFLGGVVHLLGIPTGDDTCAWALLEKHTLM